MKLATTLLGATLLAGLAAGPAVAGLSDWNLSPAKVELPGGWTASLGGEANLTGYVANQQGGVDRTGATASIYLSPRLEKLFANGWRVGVRTKLNAYHDVLSGDNYGNDLFQKVYLFVHTPFGRLELGQQDGAAYKMAMTGPLVAEDVAIDDADIVFFRDPATNDALAETFEVISAVFTTYNAAKISYYSPRLLGIRVGASYTPHLAKDVIPFVSSGPHVANRQDDLFEAAVNYTGYFGRTSVGAYAGLASGHNAQPTAGHDDVFDWAIGGEIDYDFTGATLAVGGAWRESNAYAFEPGNAFNHGTTHVVHASTKLTAGSWLFGFEYSQGVADAVSAMPKLEFTGYEASVAYVINSNLQLTGGWQHERFTRSTGAFYNGLPHVSMDAGFLYLQFHV